MSDLNRAELLNSYRGKILKALAHLEFTFKKVNKMKFNEESSEEELEVWESFSSRFTRVSDLFLTKYLKLKVLQGDPAFDGSLRDFCNVAEKISLIDSADAWIAIREMRNTTVHEYDGDDLAFFYKRLKSETPRVLEIRKIL